MVQNGDRVHDQLIRILTEQVMVGDLAVPLTTDTPLLSSGLGLDSVAVLQFVVAIEDHFGISFDVDDLSVDLFERLGTLSAKVEEKVAMLGGGVSDDAEPLEQKSDLNTA